MSLRRMAVLVFWAGLFATHINYMVDPDLWWHLKNGQYILQHGILHFDVFSYTIKGQALIAHESLFQIILWSAYKLGNLPAVMMLAAFFAF